MEQFFLAASGFALVAGAGAVLAYVSGRRRGRAVLAGVQESNESLRDEIWALRDEAAARFRAEAASDAKSRFLATVSHEIRTPLNGVIGLADLLQATELTREQTSYVDAIKSSGEALTSIIHEILDFSRIEAGHLDLNPESMSVQALVEGVAELLAPRAQGKGLEIAAHVSANLPQRMIFDAARVRQVLLNLAGNAIKFTDFGGVGIRVQPFEDEYIRFSVVDTGPGVPHAQRAMIFNEFETGDSEASRRHSGAGLGLAISQRIVQRMGGSLNLESSEGAGAHFTFTIPLQLDPALPPHPQKPALPHRRVLIVAKSPFEAPYMSQKLQELGSDVDLAENCAAALKYLAEAEFDTIIVDCALGEAETEQIASAARSAGVARALVLFSPFERHAFGQKVVAGFDGWLVKPVRADSLMQRIWPENSTLTRVPPNLDMLNLDTSEMTAAKLDLKVLLAEDDEVSLLVARKMLENLGAQITSVGDGDAAIRAFETAHVAGNPFDLCVFDIRMPKITGLQAARQIRMQESEHFWPPTCLIALSANAFEDDKAAADAAGFDAFLVKPVVMARLAEVVRAHARVLQAA